METKTRTRTPNLDMRFLVLPDHTQLPEEDGTFVKNFQEHPQSLLLTDSIRPVLDERHPDGRYAIGQDSGIYWRLTDPPERGAVAPDWFYVPNVPRYLDGRIRRSYVLWQERVPPLIVIEFVSGDGSEERDKTPNKGKFWVYENVIQPAFYAIYEVNPVLLEVYRLVEGRFELMAPNERGHFPITPLGVELGIWKDPHETVEFPWLRWWEAEGSMLPTGAERAEQERERAEQALERAERLAAKLWELGVDPDGI